MEKKSPVIAPSLLAADFLELGKDVEMINRSEAAWLHLDVMDGRFVPNISFGLPVIAQLSKVCKKVCDVHLMIEEPEKYTADFAKAGAQILSVHIEACRHLHRNIQQIKGLGMKAGVAVNPHTPIHLLEDIIGDVDVVLLMSVNPGFGGQHYIEHTYTKIRQVRKMIDASGSKALIEIDGGVTLANAAAIVEAGADVLVAGSSVFGAKDPMTAISALKNVLTAPAAK